MNFLPLDINNKFADTPPPEIPPPQDNNLKLLIEGVATLVARCGKLFEDLSREKNQSNSLFSFLNGGNGHDYYSWKLWEERQKRNDKDKQHLDGKIFPSVQKITAESRGKILGEKPWIEASKCYM
ncbi:G patch domain-containing protein TGH [Camellia lanceoleosa]|uniref:G patch domain-containing protein TGH n=1 Tax=Camellia lanceoleosa TaxID=1840588 RepID=A0ACC0I9U3_9ERIC|nr:G patch domain-containing protein TGH [Camellia lanceoleosa]